MFWAKVVAGVGGPFNMRLNDVAQVIDHAEFFSICSDEQRRMLAFASERVALKPEEALFRKGDVPRGAYVLMSGELSTLDDRGVQSTIAEPGTVIAELALLTQHPRRAKIVAKVPSEVLLVPRESFLKLVQQFPEVAEKAQIRIKADLESFVRPISNLHSNMKR